MSAVEVGTWEYSVERRIAHLYPKNYSFTLVSFYALYVVD